MSALTIDSDFPGGNGRVEFLIPSDGGAEIGLRQELRDTTTWWFYWRVRVRGGAGQALTFRFLDGDVFTNMGPCVREEGEAWRWLGREVVREDLSFTYTPTTDCVELAMAIPYLEADLRAFLAAHPQVRCTALTTSEHGRPVEHLELPSTRGTYTVLLTARHHACESMANYEIEGMIDAWLGDTPEAAFLREQVDLHVIPFIDKDGVEQGDQGKNRDPHDHNRDYTAAPRYAAVRALLAQAPGWRGQFVAMLDLHCPWIRGDRNDTVFFVLPEQAALPPITRFRAILAHSQKGEVRYSPGNDIPCGVDWNTGTAPTACRYFRTHGVGLAVTLEYAYALAGRTVITPANTRAFGANLARALGRYIQEL